MPDVIFKSLTLKTVHGRRIFDTWEQCEKLIKDKKVNSIDINIINEKEKTLPFTSLRLIDSKLF